MSDNGQRIIDLDKKRMDAMAQQDIATLNASHSSAFSGAEAQVHTGSRPR